APRPVWRRPPSGGGGFSRSRRQVLPGGAPGGLVVAAQVRVVGRIGPRAPLRAGYPPLARPIVAARPARRFARLLRRSRTLRDGHCGGRDVAIGYIRA